MPDAFESIYQEHLSRVYGFFGYRVSSRSDAEDLTQLAFERAWRAWPTYDPARAAVGTWLLAIARNLLVDHYRTDGRAVVRLVGDWSAEEERATPGPESASLGLSPELERALSRLGDREREIIALRYGGELRGKEIAELTGLTLANVHQITSRALGRLRAALAPDGG